MILQELWKLKLDWDESVPISPNSELRNLINNIEVPSESNQNT